MTKKGIKVVGIFWTGMYKNKKNLFARWHPRTSLAPGIQYPLHATARTGSSSDWCALQEPLYKCIDTIQYNTIQYNTIHCYVISCYFMLSYMLCHTMLCYVTPCYVMLCYVTLRYVTLCYAMLCYAMCFISCYVVLCYAVQTVAETWRRVWGRKTFSRTNI